MSAPKSCIGGVPERTQWRSAVTFVTIEWILPSRYVYSSTTLRAKWNISSGGARICVQSRRTAGERSFHGSVSSRRFCFFAGRASSSSALRFFVAVLAFGLGLDEVVLDSSTLIASESSVIGGVVASLLFPLLFRDGALALGLDLTAFLGTSSSDDSATDSGSESDSPPDDASKSESSVFLALAERFAGAFFAPRLTLGLTSSSETSSSSEGIEVLRTILRRLGLGASDSSSVSLISMGAARLDALRTGMTTSTARPVRGLTAGFLIVVGSAGASFLTAGFAAFLGLPSGACFLLLSAISAASR